METDGNSQREPDLIQSPFSYNVRVCLRFVLRSRRVGWTTTVLNKSSRLKLVVAFGKAVRIHQSIIGLACIIMPGAVCSAQRQELAPPVVEGRWVRPSAEAPAQPVWGHAEGLRVGLYPLRGPRGLLRIYAPYLKLPENHVINFIAVEPTVVGQEGRGLSELEASRLDHVAGKRFWSGDTVDTAIHEPEQPARGWIERADGVEKLCVFVFVERFANGAHVYLRLTFRADRPREVGLATFTHADSQPLSYCIVTATMGNFARLRRLHLAERTVLAHELWPAYDGVGFTPHARFGLEELARNAAGQAGVVATPDEAEPQQAQYAQGTMRGWRYQGELASQGWRAEKPTKQLAVQVNGRRVYWNSTAPIPGGVAYENFELVEPFQQGQEYWFGVQPGGSPEIGAW